MIPTCSASAVAAFYLLQDILSLTMPIKVQKQSSISTCQPYVYLLEYAREGTY